MLQSLSIKPIAQRVGFFGQLTLVFSGVIGGVISIGALVWYNTNALRLSNQWIEHTYEVIISSEKVFSLSKDLQRAQRGYVITVLANGEGDPSFLVPYNKATNQLNSEVAKLRSLVRDNRTQSDRVRILQNEVVILQTAVAEVIDLTRNGAVDDAIESVAAGEVKAIVDEIEVVNNQVLLEEEVLLEQRRALVNRLVFVQRSSIATLIFIAFAAPLFAAHIIAGEIARRKKIEDELKKLNSLLAEAKELTQQKLIAAGREWQLYKDSNKQISSDLSRLEQLLGNGDNNN